MHDTAPRAFTPTDRTRLTGVHPDLVAVLERALATSPVAFRITEGLRTLARQRRLLAAGATRTLRSRHLTGHAVDVAALVGSQVRWDWPLYGQIAAAVKSAAAELRIPIVWGGDWKTFRDGPHYELDRRHYP